MKCDRNTVKYIIFLIKILQIRPLQTHYFYTHSVQKPDFCKPINTNIERQKEDQLCECLCLPRISMTDPVLSSFAGRNPPNPVLAVTSGSPELEFDPENIEFYILSRNRRGKFYLLTCWCLKSSSAYCLWCRALICCRGNLFLCYFWFLYWRRGRWRVLS